MDIKVGTMHQHNKKKICILMPYHWSYGMGGAEYQSKCIIDALYTSGLYEVFFLARYVDPAFVQCDHKIFRIQNTFGIKKGNYFVDAFSIHKELARIKPDIIYQRVGSAYTGIGACYIKKHGGKFVWHIARDDDVAPYEFQLSRRMLGKYIDKKFLEYGISNATHIIAQTNDQADLLKQNYSRTPTEIIHNFHPVPVSTILKKKPIKIVWIANLKSNKRPEIFLSLAKELSYMQGVEFIMIGALQGNSAWRNEILDKINRASNINYMGRLSQEDVNNVLSGAHIFVNTSKLEGFPNTFIQAWMRRVPVVSLTINPDNVFESNEIGFCSNTFDGLKDNTLMLIENDELRRKMGGCAQEYAFRIHSDKNAANLLSILEG